MRRFLPYLIFLSLWVVSVGIIYSVYQDRLSEYKNEIDDASRETYTNALELSMLSNRVYYFENFDSFKYGKLLKNISTSSSSKELKEAKVLLESFASPLLLGTNETNIESVSFYTKDYMHIESISKDEMPYIANSDILQKIDGEFIYFPSRDNRLNFIQKISFQGSIVGFIQFSTSLVEAINKFSKNKTFTFELLDDKEKQKEKCIFTPSESICYINLKNLDDETVGTLLALNKNTNRTSIENDFLIKIIGVSLLFIFLPYLYRKNEKVVFKQNEFLQNIIDNIPHPVFVKDSELRYKMVNSSTVEFFGKKSKGELLNKDDMTICSDAAMASRFMKQDREVLDKQEAIFIKSEELKHAKNELPSWYQTSKLPIIRDGEKMLLGIAIDITKNENLKRELSKLNAQLNMKITKEVDSRLRSEERYKDLFENINEVVIVLRYEGGICRVIEANLKALKFFELSKDEILRSDVQHLFGFKDNKECMFDKMKLNENLDRNLTIPVKDELKIANIRARAYINNSYRYITISMTDITDHIRLKKEKKEHKKLLETLFKKASSAICILDENHQFIKFNKGFCKIIESTQEEVQECSFLDFLDKSQHQMFCDETRMIFSNSSDIQNEYMLKSKNSKSSNVLGSSVMIRNNHDAYRLLILEDITKIKNLEESQKEQERMMAQQAKMAEMGDMIGAIAHQWRQPLNSINAASMKLRFLHELGKLESTNLTETTEFIESQSSKMSDTINDFLNFFKPSKEKDLFTVAEVVDNIKKMLGVQLENRNITLIGEIEDDLMIYGYKNELEHVILNLITNARDAFEGKNIHPQIIELNAKSSEDKISISVEDSAGGIPEKIINKIFNPYFSTKPTDKGTGIGLYMSKNIIEKGFDGKISATNSENGARFEIILKRGRDG